MIRAKNYSGYHDEVMTAGWLGISLGHWDTQFDYRFEDFFHPFVGELIAKLNRDSLPGVMDAVWQDSLKTPDPVADPAHDFFHILYAPTNDQLTRVESFAKQIDVGEHGTYANYNWELFFHIPVMVAVHLSKTQRFAEAQRWFHYVFDPTSTDKATDPPKRFWKFLAFRQDQQPKQIDYLLTLLSKNPADLSPDDQQARQDILDGYQAILDKPFQPHAVARTRHLAYQYNVVMKYLDNLIAWGDNLFQQDTIESINEATQRYVLAANILGPRPQQIPPTGTVQVKTYAQLKTAGLDPMGNALVDLESQFPFNFASATSGDGSGSGPLFGIGRALYFCVPRNDKLLGYWDTVANRLFNIRHCMNIAGVVRPLALFDPPLDPGMLVKAAAAGIDISSIVSGLNQPIGPVRSTLLIQKALELCSEVRGLGSALLAALEKGDGEHLSLLRQKHEIQIQTLMQDVRFLQWKNAQESTKSLLTSRATVLERLRYYQRLLGLPADQNAPDTLTIDQRELTEANFDESYAALVGQYDKAIAVQPFPNLQLTGATSPAQQSGASGSGRLYLSRNEDAELNTHLPTARDTRLAANVADNVAGVLALIPDFDVNLQYWGLGGTSKIFGGVKLSAVSKIAAEVLKTISAYEQDQAGMAGRTAGHERRADEWMLQYNLAAHELMQNGRQILTSLIAEQIAHHEYLNIQQQIANAHEIDDFLHTKFTNEELYLWMQGEISRLYYEYYRFAFDTARKAERTMKQELMRPELDAQDFVKFNYWDGGRKGLLSGEALHLDVKRMEMAYHDNNKRELELTRHISLRQLDSVALLTLKTTGTCTVSAPEWLFDRDCPGHYMRRIKNVALSIPSVVGPYTALNCTLTLLGSSVRKSPLLADGEYARQGSADDRFVDYPASAQSIVTSAGSNDTGLFETNLRDERFLPFEGAGAVSTWRIELPRDFPAFDFNTISDVVLHMRYTARQGLDKTKVVQAVNDLFSAATDTPLAMLFSLPHDFPVEWSAFVNGAADFQAAVRRDYFPYFTQGKNLTITSLELYGGPMGGPLRHHAVAGADLDAFSNAMNNADPAQQSYTVDAPPDAAGPTQVLTRNASTEVYLVVRYTVG
jgi:hypothetical protein